MLEYLLDGVMISYKIEKNIEIKIYQFEALNHKIKNPLNMVIIVARNLKNDKKIHTKLSKNYILLLFTILDRV